MRASQSRSTSRDDDLLRLVAARNLSSFEIWRFVSKGPGTAPLSEAELLPELRRLTMRGLIVGRRDGDSGTTRRRYMITWRGKQVADRARYSHAADRWGISPSDGESLPLAIDIAKARDSVDAAIADYTVKLVSVLRVTAPAEDAIRNEVEDHILDSVASLHSRHVPLGEALSQAMLSLGDPKTLGREIAHPIHAPRRQLVALARAALILVPCAALGAVVAGVFAYLLASATVAVAGLLVSAVAGRDLVVRQADWSVFFATLVLGAGAVVGTAGAVSQFQLMSLCRQSWPLTAFVLLLAAGMLVIALFAPLNRVFPSSLVLLVLPLAPVVGAALVPSRIPDRDVYVYEQDRAFFMGRPFDAAIVQRIASLFGVASRRTVAAFAALTILLALASTNFR